MSIVATLILTTALAGVGGTGLGGLVGAMLQKDSNRTVSLLLSFAGGVMLSVVCCDLVIEAIETQVGAENAGGPGKGGARGWRGAFSEITCILVSYIYLHIGESFVPALSSLCRLYRQQRMLFA